MRCAGALLTAGKEVSLCTSNAAFALVPYVKPLAMATSSSPSPLSVSAQSPPQLCTCEFLAGRPSQPVHSFVESFMSENPRAFFNDLIMAWGASLQEQEADEALSCVPLRERQLLNRKLYDPCFATVRLPLPPHSNVSATVTPCVDVPIPCTWEAARAGTAACDADRGASVRGDAPSRTGVVVPPYISARPVDLRQPGGLFYAYSLVHFAAELGSTELLEFALSRLPNGVPFAPRCEPVTAHPSMPILPLAPHRSLFPSVDWIACHGADFTGAFPSHLASASGATVVLEWLTSRYGAEVILRQQRTYPSLRGGLTSTASSQRVKRLSAVGSALAKGQISTLEWLIQKYPEHLREEVMPSNLAVSLLAGAVRQDDGCACTLQFLHTHQLIRGSVFHRSWGSPHLASPTDIREALRDAGFSAVLFAAAEAGNLGVLEWFMWRCDEQIISVTDRVGATVVHHCARGGHAELLRALIHPTKSLSPHSGSATRDAASETLFNELWNALPASERCALIDAPDDFGRTPAVWCVLSSARPFTKVKVLTALLALGSAWPRYQSDQGHTLLTLALQKHSHFSPLCRYIRSHCTHH